MDHLLTRVLEVWRPTAVPDGLGGQHTTLLRVGTVRAKVDQPSAGDRLVAAQSGGRHTHTVYLRPGAAVARHDELRGDGQRFTVHHVFEPSAPVYRRADCELTQTEGEP
ncbi:head-tail adaptor protein [Kitasatospora purpeofusca]|uniref:head-tail adaptor protein n=1 Tax=Kitasatospora purpeofusca TaxID=67352 RepID=UPI0022553566|nr:head-tail adaptor protein [Kitasatospora purpeofusca]MCX4686766.1 head-tail adaptor protein [Kitasatospora purpeofusca]